MITSCPNYSHPPWGGGRYPWISTGFLCTHPRFSLVSFLLSSSYSLYLPLVLSVLKPHFYPLPFLSSFLSSATPSLSLSTRSLLSLFLPVFSSLFFSLPLSLFLQPTHYLLPCPGLTYRLPENQEAGRLTDLGQIQWW